MVFDCFHFFSCDFKILIFVGILVGIGLVRREGKENIFYFYL
jgi:hypothetical protein